MAYFVRILIYVIVVALAISVSGCGGGSTATTPATCLSETNPNAEVAGSTWPVGLPVDSLQPWEELDAGGKVSTGLNAHSEFLCGVERVYDSGAAVSDLGEAVHIESGEVGSGVVSWVMYRILMGGEQPGVVTADVNPAEMSDGELSSYYVGLSNYGAARWDWFGPFTDNHVRLSTGAAVRDGEDYLSDLGNHFVTVVAFDGAVLDVVGVGTNAYEATDTDAPPVPTGLYTVPVYGGLDIYWNHVIAGDLAGYRIYYCNAEFSAIDAAGVQCLPYLIGQDNHLLSGLDGKTYVRISAVDISGNESALSDAAIQTPLGGLGPDLRLGVSSASGLINDGITLTAIGAVNYDWDLDGDGIFEVTGETTGIQAVDTGHTGILRPSVRGTTGDGSCVSCAAVSLIIAGNSRPVASALAAPAMGNAPLFVTLTGNGLDDDGTISSYSWDFDGDGTFDQTDATDPGPVQHTYDMAGMYNAKFRVEDDKGSWDVDTVSIFVAEPTAANNPPVADLVVGAGEESGDAPHSVHFDASGSTDPDGAEDIVEYHWDFDGDGLYDGMTYTATYAYTYGSPGVLTARVAVEDSHGATATDSVTITVNVEGNDLPVADLTADVTNGDLPLTVSFDATGSSDPDGCIVRYDYDLDGDGNYELYDGGDSSQWEYTSSGVFNATLRVTDDDGAQDTEALSIDVNALPVAELVAGSSAVEKNDGLWLYADGSYDDGSIVDYEWDLDGDGVFNETGNEADAQGNDMVYFYVDTAGRYTYTVRVTDDDGGQSTDSERVTVHGWWVITLDETGTVGNHNSIAEVNGRPAITYQDYTNYRQKYIVAQDEDGLVWNSPLVVDTLVNSGGYSSLAVVDGNPAISYVNLTDFDLRYVRATDSLGSAWGTPIDIDSDGLVGTFSSLCVVNGNPAISYYKSSTTQLKYVRALDSTGSSWGTPVIPDDVDLGGSYTCLRIINGRPGISYLSGSSNLKFVRAADDNGASWAFPAEISTSHTCYLGTGLCEVDGRAAIAYNDNSSGELNYVRATSDDGSTWGAPLVIETGGEATTTFSLLMRSGKPIISFHDSNTVCIVEALDCQGSTWKSPETIDDCSHYQSMVLINDVPMISYRSNSSLDLRFARLY